MSTGPAQDKARSADVPEHPQAPDREPAELPTYNNSYVLSVINEKTRQEEEREAEIASRQGPVAGGIAGQVTSGTKGLLSLSSVQGTFALPGGKLLSGELKRELRTVNPTLITVRITSADITVTMSPALYIDAIWPARNMILRQVVYKLSSGETTVDVATVSGEFGDGFISATDEAQSAIAGLVTSIVRRTPLVWADMQHPPPAPTSPAELARSRLAKPRVYDPLRDADPKFTLQALAAGFQALPSGGTSDVGAADVSHLRVGATVTFNRDVAQVEEGTGVSIAAGTTAELTVASGASIPALSGAGGDPAALATAADVQEIRVVSNGVFVVKDGARLASIDEVVISRGGGVSVARVTLYGKAREAADSEVGSRLLFGALLGVAATGSAGGWQAGAELAGNRYGTDAAIVPGIARGLIQSKLQAAFAQVLAQHRRTAIPGIDLGSVLGIPASGPSGAPRAP